MASLYVMIVEDEPLIAMAMEMLVQDEEGGVALGPHGAVTPALAEIEKGGRIDVAMLDCNLGKDASWPVADALVARGIPFVFTTGQGGKDIPDRFHDRPAFPKPVDDEKLKRFIRRYSRKE